MPEKLLKHGYEIELTRRLLAHFDVDCVLDIGANRGQFRDQLRDDVGWDGPLVSVEPQPSLAAHLRERARSDPKWTIHECALAAAPGRAALNVMASDLYSSLLEPNAGIAFGDGTATRVVGRVDVEVRTLDELYARVAPELGVRRPFLKLDTQGCDLQVLAGAAGMLENVVALQTELSFQALYRGIPSWLESVTRLKELGFEASGFTPIDPVAQFPKVFELNGFFVSSRHADA